MVPQVAAAARSSGRSARRAPTSSGSWRSWWRNGRPNPSASGDDVLTRLIASTAKETDKRVADRRMRDELVTLLLAGHETTASTVGWTLHLVEPAPARSGERLHEEAVAVYGDRRPAYEDLTKLRYTNMVLQEAMRLYPPVWILTAQGGRRRTRSAATTCRPARRC